MVNEQAAKAGLELAAVILEPVGRNTAPAVAIAALKAAEADPEALLLLLPSDHVILDTPGFHKAVNDAACAANQDYLVCFGMTPDKPETGYGYIAAGAEITGAKGAHVIEGFKEKPNEETAAGYLEQGGYYWNSGMFMFAAKPILAEFEKYQGTMLEACKKALASAEPDLNFLRLVNAEFGAIYADSIDYAIMEKLIKPRCCPPNLAGRMLAASRHWPRCSRLMPMAMSSSAM